MSKKIKRPKIDNFYDKSGTLDVYAFATELLNYSYKLEMELLDRERYIKYLTR